MYKMCPTYKISGQHVQHMANLLAKIFNLPITYNHLKSQIFICEASKKLLHETLSNLYIFNISI